MTMSTRFSTRCSLWAFRSLSSASESRCGAEIVRPESVSYDDLIGKVSVPIASDWIEIVGWVFFGAV